MDFNSLGCPSPPPQLQFHDISRFLSFPKATKSQGGEGNLSSSCFKAPWEMPWGTNVHLSRDAAGLEPSLQPSGASPSPGGRGTPRAGAFLQRCPKPRALVGARNWSCPFQLDPGALTLPAPSPSPLRFLPQRREQSCLLCCFFTPLHLHLQTS